MRLVEGIPSMRFKILPKIKSIIRGDKLRSTTNEPILELIKLFSIFLLTNDLSNFICFRHGHTAQVYACLHNLLLVKNATICVSCKLFHNLMDIRYILLTVFTSNIIFTNCVHSPWSNQSI